jgi:SAM-dependent methyltransferase
MIKLFKQILVKLNIRSTAPQTNELPDQTNDLSENIPLDIFDETLREIDIKLPLTGTSDLPELFKDIPLDIFGNLLLQTPEQFPNIKNALPTMASEDTQNHWTGNSGEELQRQSVAFMRTMTAGFTAISSKNLASCTVLDYGCGWGRLTRLLCKLVPLERIYAVDPYDASIRECEKHKVMGNIHLSDWVPKTLPVDCQFDLIFAFSVFSHLSEKTMHIVLKTLHNYILPGGVLAITIRPKEYWKFHDDRNIAKEMEKMHGEKGFAFAPHNLAPIDGDITYGDTSMSLEYIKRNFTDWTISRIEYNLVDVLQIILFLEPVRPQSV